MTKDEGYEQREQAERYEILNDRINCQMGGKEFKPQPKKPIVKTGYLLAVVIPLSEHNDIRPDRVFMEEYKAKEFLERHRKDGYELIEIPVIIEAI